MNTSVGEMWDNIMTIARCRNSESEVKIMKRLTNQCYTEICALTSWVDLRDSKTYDFSAAPDSTGYYLEANLLGVDAVRGSETDDYREYVQRDLSGIDFEEGIYRWCFTETLLTPVASGRDLSISNGSTTFIADTLTTNYANDYVKFGKEPGLYLLSAIKTFSPTYWGSPMTDGEWQIRPQGTKKFSIYDSGGDFDDDSTVTVHYWKLPGPLYRDNDLIILPNSRVLELMVLIRFIGQLRKNEIDASIYRNELYGSDGKAGLMADMIRDNPSFPRGRGVRDVTNVKMTYSEDIFGNRGGAGTPSADPKNEGWLSWADHG